MLNDVLAVGVAGAVVVVIATILGAVELLRKAVAAIAGPWIAWSRRGRHRGRDPPRQRPREPPQQERSTAHSAENSSWPDL